MEAAACGLSEAAGCAAPSLAGVRQCGAQSKPSEKIESPWITPIGPGQA